MSADRSARADAFMEGLQRERAGRLTVFLGAAPGVGKTYAMLVRARELQRQGVDILAGVVETHGRSETLALLEGLPRLATKRIDYHGHVLEELDLDGLIARRPQVALVDELAHRNAPGSRHERRWQDVEELLAAGIDVYTTVNVQHLESLNDVVHQITGVRVSETVPDAVFAQLRDIRLVDLPARELIERLNQGKVYLPEQAAHALQAFFSPSNLTALRELAMQTVAEHVDADLREAGAARGVGGLSLRRHVLIAIDGRGQSEYLVRAGRRMAERRGAPWSVVTVETGRGAAVSTADAQGQGVRGATSAAQARQLEIDRAFALARRLGGETAILHSGDVAGALLDEAAAQGASAIVIGRTRERPIARMFNRTLTQQLLRRGARYELTIVSTPQTRLRAQRMGERATRWLAGRELALVLFATAVAVALAALGQRYLEFNDLSMVFMTAVLVVASRTRMAAAVVTAVLCFLAYNFFFIEPRFSFLISARQGVITVLIFLAAALIAGRLASRLRMQVLALRAANTHAAALQALGRQLATAADLGQVIAAGRVALQGTLHAQVWLRINGQESVLESGGVDPDHGPDGSGVSSDTYRKRPETDAGPDDKARVAATWSEQHGQACGRYTDTISASPWWFLPVRADRDTVGVVGLRFPETMDRLAFEQRRLAEAMVEDIAQAALRARLVADLEVARVAEETERLRSALLSSVSHDLRSPLSSMIGSAESLSSYGTAMSETDRRELLETIRMEGERLDRYIQNLLDMTRLGQQGLKLTRDWIGVDELIGSATQRLARYLPGVRFTLDLAPLPPLHVHPALLEQALFNVLENAAKFSPPEVPIGVMAREVDGALRIEISDRGPGIPEDERRRIFDMFYSVERGDRGKHGTGLGLTIVQSIVGAHMGSVEALPGEGGRGTTIRITLALEAAPTENAA